MPSELITILMLRDSLTEREARELCKECAEAIHDGEDPQDAMQDVLGIEPDYFLDLMEFMQ